MEQIEFALKMALNFGALGVLAFVLYYGMGFVERRDIRFQEFLSTERMRVETVFREIVDQIREDAREGRDAVVRSESMMGKVSAQLHELEISRARNNGSECNHRGA